MFVRPAGVNVIKMMGVVITDEALENRVVIVEGSLHGYEKMAIYNHEYKLIVSQDDGVQAGFTVPEEHRVTIRDGIRERMLQKLPP